mmetsp:Transcript_8741/g.20829  ORF Transcript_8741/g.20829 Transcript_8741/m.20829 type:complete len:133 (+) Transcript_8741:78-476(+)
MRLVLFPLVTLGLYKERGVLLFERDDEGAIFVPESSFEDNWSSRRGGNKAWDACRGGQFDNNHSIWPFYRDGPRIEAFQVVGNWTLRFAKECGLTHSYSGFEVSSNFTAASGRVPVERVAYVEAVEPGTTLV